MAVDAPRDVGGGQAAREPVGDHPPIAEDAAIGEADCHPRDHDGVLHVVVDDLLHYPEELGVVRIRIGPTDMNPFEGHLRVVDHGGKLGFEVLRFHPGEQPDVESRFCPCRDDVVLDA